MVSVGTAYQRATSGSGVTRDDKPVPGLNAGMPYSVASINKSSLELAIVSASLSELPSIALLYTGKG